MYILYLQLEVIIRVTNSSGSPLINNIKINTILRCTYHHCSLLTLVLVYHTSTYTEIYYSINIISTSCLSYLYIINKVSLAFGCLNTLPLVLVSPLAQRLDCLMYEVLAGEVVLNIPQAL